MPNALGVRVNLTHAIEGIPIRCLQENINHLTHTVAHFQTVVGQIVLAWFSLILNVSTAPIHGSRSQLAKGPMAARERGAVALGLTQLCSVRVAAAHPADKKR